MQLALRIAYESLQYLAVPVVGNWLFGLLFASIDGTQALAIVFIGILMKAMVIMFPPTPEGYLFDTMQDKTLNVDEYLEKATYRELAITSIGLFMGIASFITAIVSTQVINMNDGIVASVIQIIIEIITKVTIGAHLIMEIYHKYRVLQVIEKSNNFIDYVIGTLLNLWFYAIYLYPAFSQGVHLRIVFDL
ncbi:hypothetical protein FGO68_gene3806 [Halteria grandinella]|uniref:Uncharacterized protein n=1 Tax=Halteria grandinella TaxID=5974 RepID=A0A8J8SYE2_HALGN|nr:hypothetical protein FGO68_gene3806 [Halteria grandinella]